MSYYARMLLVAIAASGVIAAPFNVIGALVTLGVSIVLGVEVLLKEDI